MYTLMLLQMTLLTEWLINSSQQNGFSPLCMFWCVFRCLRWLNELLQTSQQNGFAPLCMCWCVFRWLRWLNDLLHSSKQNGRTPLCMHWCFFRWLCLMNDFLHTSHQNSCSPLCMLRWAIRICSWLNESPHSSQEYRRSSPCTGLSSFKLLWKMRVNNMKNPNRKRIKFESSIQWDIKSVSVRVVREGEGGGGRGSESTPPVWCEPESISIYGGFWVNRS
jgi:hypothetical protein